MHRTFWKLGDPDTKVRHPEARPNHAIEVTLPKEKKTLPQTLGTNDSQAQDWSSEALPLLLSKKRPNASSG